MGMKFDFNVSSNGKFRHQNHLPVSAELIEIWYSFVLGVMVEFGEWKHTRTICSLIAIVR